MYKDEAKQKVFALLDGHLRQDTQKRVGQVQAIHFDFVEDTVVVSGTEGLMQCKLSLMVQLATDTIIH